MPLIIPFMNYKTTKAPKEVVTRDLKHLESQTGNIYETINILSRRSNQINLQIKSELMDKMLEFTAPSTDTLEEIFQIPEQVELSRYYEKLPKSTALSIEEYEKEKLSFHYKNREHIDE